MFYLCTDLDCCVRYCALEPEGTAWAVRRLGLVSGETGGYVPRIVINVPTEIVQDARRLRPRANLENTLLEWLKDGRNKALQQYGGSALLIVGEVKREKFIPSPGRGTDPLTVPPASRGVGPRRSISTGTKLFRGPRLK